ncbi:hypothetical protein H5410_047006 [Solanum commersonii]|uniref:Uncharacterized protein n=1 Tax=Solanum commersonii TaxID=4109 RepID=A0A9J5XH34_SOLCO|nr:hypothetical protein H5410_047006 [Solanum commersonii]
MKCREIVMSTQLKALVSKNDDDSEDSRKNEKEDQNDTEQFQLLATPYQKSPSETLHDVVTHQKNTVQEAESGYDESVTAVEEDIAENMEDDANWKQNIISINTQQAFNRLQMLNKHHNYFLIALMEPFQHMRHLWRLDVEVISDTEQQITTKTSFLEYQKQMIITMVYAKCSEEERLDLWNDIYSGIDTLFLDEKIGGLPLTQQEMEDFAFCVNSCKLEEIPFKDYWQTRILWNGSRQWRWIIYLELGRIMPMFLTMSTGHQPVVKPFKFLSFWVEDITLNEVVLQHWKTNETGNNFWIFKHKLKNLKKALRVWSKERYGEIFQQLTIRVEIMKMKEQLFEEDPSFSNRMAIQQAQA